MTSLIFFDKSINEANLYLYDDYVVNFICAKNIDKGIEEVEKELEKVFGLSSINHSKLNKFLFNYSCKLNNLDYRNALSKVRQFKNIFGSLLSLSIEEINKEISKYITQKLFNINSLLPYLYALDKKTSNKENIFYHAIYFNFVLFESDYLFKLDSSVVNIKDSYNNISLKQIIRNNFILEILFSNGINTIKDLESVNVLSLMCLFSLDFINIYQTIDNLKDDYSTNLKENVTKVFDGLNENELNIISLRYGFNGKSKTLEQVGKELNLTRERIRQIEKRIEEKVLLKTHYVNSQIISLFNYLAESSGKYASSFKLKKFCDDTKLYNYLLYILQISDSPIKYDANLELLYNVDIATPTDFANEIINTNGDIIDKSYIDKFDICEQKVVLKHYRLYKNAIYLRRGVSGSNITAEIINEIFPDGYKINDNETYEILCKELRNRFGEDFEIASRRALDARLVERNDFCQIDRGLYKNRFLCASIQDDLKNKIISFISNNSPICDYRTIFETFKKDLNETGINNYYYLKGVIDPLLPSEFKTKRNYIQTTAERIRETDAILNYIKSFDKEFSLDDLKHRFGGVKEYTFYNILYKEIEESGLVALSNHRFVYVYNLGISNKARDELKKIIDDLFDILHEDTISIRKIYARISLLNRDLFSNLKINEDCFTLFSLIKALFKKEYGFNRPLISKDINIETDILNVISNYAKKLDSFNKRIINDYVKKMNLRDLYSYLIFMEDMSDDYVQINIDSMIKKDLIEIKEDQLNQIFNMLNLVLNRFDSIDTKIFNGYIMFPKLSYQWNKYLLVGIVRTYFSEDFEVENTKTNYTDTDFIIRRIK